MEWIIYTLLGGIGGLVTYVDWRINKKELHEKTKVSKLIRNFSIGAIVGGFFGIATSNQYIAIMTGLAGEFCIQKIGKIIGRWI